MQHKYLGRVARSVRVHLTLAVLGAGVKTSAVGAQVSRTVSTLIVGVPAHEMAHDSAVLSLHAIYAAIDRTSPRIRVADAMAKAAAARVPGATKPPDPQLQLAFMNYSVPRLMPDVALGMRQLQLMQMVPLPGKLSAAGDAARARAEAVSARAVDVRWEVRVAAAMAFYDLWAAGERLVLARATRRLLEDAAAVATAMYRVGEGRQSDVLRARVEIARMDEEIIRMQSMAEVAKTRLAATVDLPDSAMAGTPVLTAFPDTIPDRSSLVTVGLRGRPMLLAAEAEVRAAAAEARLARRERWPDLQIGVQYGERGMATGTDRMGSVMVGASLPVFAGSRQLRMRDEAAAMYAMTEAELRAMQADTRARLTEVHAELARARRLRTLYITTVLPQAEAAASSSLASYRYGAVDFMAVLDNRMTVNRYREELVALTAAEGRAWADLEMLVSQTLLGPRGTR